MNTQEHTLEGNISVETGVPSQAEIDTEFDKIVGEIQPTPESKNVKEIVAFKGVQRGEPQENNYQFGKTN